MSQILKIISKKFRMGRQSTVDENKSASLSKLKFSNSKKTTASII